MIDVTKTPQGEMESDTQSVFNIPNQFNDDQLGVGEGLIGRGGTAHNNKNNTLKRHTSGSLSQYNDTAEQEMGRQTPHLQTLQSSISKEEEKKEVKHQSYKTYDLVKIGEATDAEEVAEGFQLLATRVITQENNLQKNDEKIIDWLCQGQRPIPVAENSHHELNFGNIPYSDQQRKLACGTPGRQARVISEPGTNFVPAN